jgi:hypothetical protein
MSDIQPDARVLEDTDTALLEAETPAAGAETVEFADLNDLGKTTTGPAQAAAKPAAAAAQPTGDEDVPEQFRGKSKKDIVKMYQDAHQVIGRQGSELGELRQKADFAIKASLEALRGRKTEEPAKPATPAAAEPQDESAFFAKPYDAVGKAIENHPLIKEIRETLGRGAAEQAASRATAATEQFNRTHPDAPDILRDPEFRQWVSASPIRRSLLQRAHQAYDFHAGDEVFSTWKALRGAKQPAAKAGETAAQPAAAAAGATAAEVSAAAATLAAARKAKAVASASAAAVPTAGASGAGKPSGGKKIFRRSDVIRLMETDPERYEMLADEISLAYAENRVR